MTWFISWIRDFLYGINTLFEWLTLPLIDIGGISFTPITLVSITGLTIYLTLAVVKWLIS